MPSPLKSLWNCAAFLEPPPSPFGASQVMATLGAFQLMPPGVHVTPASEPKSGAAVVTINAIMSDATILDPTPLVITTLALEQSIDDGLTWTALSKVSWESDPLTVPKPPSTVLPRPGLSTTVPDDGNTRRFRARLDLPVAVLVGLDVTVV